MTQIHKIRPTNDRLVEWSPEEEEQMAAVISTLRSRDEPKKAATETRPPRKSALRHTRRCWYRDGGSSPPPQPKTAKETFYSNLPEIRRMCAHPGYRMRDIAARHGMSASTLAWYAHASRMRVVRYCRSRAALLRGKGAIREMLRHGETARAIARQVGVSRAALSKFISKHKLK